MMISNKSKQLGLYKSILKDFLIENFNYDNSKLIYSNKYMVSSFSITKPNDNYKNCIFINGYPHFQIPKEVCLEEILSYVNGDKLYDDNITIRYGDIHPNKPVPMLGQLRNIIIDEVLVNMIRTNGAIENVFSIGDISEKTIKYFLQTVESKNSEEQFNFLVNSIFNGENLNDQQIIDYQKFCLEQTKKTNDFLKKIFNQDLHYLFESKLYREKELYKYIKQLYCDDSLKENGLIKYVLQEFMFLLNEKYKQTKIINIIGSDQSEHIKKVLNVIQDNNIKADVSFLTYGICKNASSRDISEWEKSIETKIKENNFRIDEETINWLDFLKFSGVLMNTENVLDFENLKWFNTKPLEEIFNSIKVAKNVSSNNNIYPNDLLYKMTLVNQVFDDAVVNGNPSKITRYLYELAKEYNSNIREYEGMSELYYCFVEKTLEHLTLDKTEKFQKVLNKRS